MPETDIDFREQIEPHRKALQAHCYRMLGSLHDAEDLTQEAMLRAWNRRGTFEGRSSLKTWLQKIATNACLDALAQRRPRSLPSAMGPASEAGEPPGAPVAEPIWLTPAPDTLVGDAREGPEARYSARESIALAFLVALQLLPPRQRAVLLLRDVLGWEATEVAESLEMTVAAANSALQRARETLARPREPEDRSMSATLDDHVRALLHRYMRAWEDADQKTLVNLLHEEVSFAMPPMPAWYQGRESVAGFIAGLLEGQARGRFRMRLTAANDRPAVAIYQRDPAAGDYRPLGIQVVELVDGRIRDLVTFMDASLFPKFGLPMVLEEVVQPSA